MHKSPFFPSEHKIHAQKSLIYLINFDIAIHFDKIIILSKINLHSMLTKLKILPIHS